MSTEGTLTPEVTNESPQPHLAKQDLSTLVSDISSAYFEPDTVVYINTHVIY